MKISTKGRYALRLMMELAMGEEGRAISVKEISARQNISVKYLEQIISILAKAGYVRSVRGPQGGYSLKRAPGEYTVGEILRLTEGSLAPVSCVEEDANYCEREKYCATVELWRRVNQAVNEVVDHTTLADLVCIQKEKNDGAACAAD